MYSCVTLQVSPKDRERCARPLRCSIFLLLYVHVFVQCRFEIFHQFGISLFILHFSSVVFVAVMRHFCFHHTTPVVGPAVRPTYISSELWPRSPGLTDATAQTSPVARLGVQGSTLVRGELVQPFPASSEPVARKMAY